MAFGKVLAVFVLLLTSVIIIMSSWLDSPKGSTINFCYSTKAQQQKDTVDTPERVTFPYKVQV